MSLAYRRWLLRTFENNEARELLEGHLMDQALLQTVATEADGEKIDSTVTLDRRSRVRFLSAEP